jgi:hypothetical protein
MENGDMWLAFCDSTDKAALWAVEGLRARGLAPLLWVSPEELARSRCWEHRVNRTGADIAITLADGSSLEGQALRGVLNRLAAVPYEPLRHIEPEDREYPSQELTAFFLSWLHGLPCSVLNRATPQGLSGAWRHRSEWFWLAAQAGLPTPRYRQSSLPDGEVRDAKGTSPSSPLVTVFVVGGHVVGEIASPSILSGCRRLARLTGTPLLGIDFTVDAGGAWTFSGATPQPDLRLGGNALLDALALALQGDKEESNP